MNTTDKKVSHTPGPWKTNGTTVLDSNGFGIADAEETLVLSGWADTGAEHWSRRPGQTYREIEWEEAEANARLIAAAPDLLRVIQETEAWLSFNVRPDADQIRVFRNELKEVIKKATE